MTGHQVAVESHENRLPGEDDGEKKAPQLLGWKPGVMVAIQGLSDAPYATVDLIGIDSPGQITWATTVVTTVQMLADRDHDAGSQLRRSASPKHSRRGQVWLDEAANRPVERPKRRPARHKHTLHSLMTRIDARFRCCRPWQRYSTPGTDRPTVNRKTVPADRRQRDYPTPDDFSPSRDPPGSEPAARRVAPRLAGC